MEKSRKIKQDKKTQRWKTIFSLVLSFALQTQMENDETVEELNENKMYLWRWTVSRHTDVIYLT